MGNPKADIPINNKLQITQNRPNAIVNIEPPTLPSMPPPQPSGYRRLGQIRKIDGSAANFLN